MLDRAGGGGARSAAAWHSLWLAMVDELYESCLVDERERRELLDETREEVSVRSPEAMRRPAASV